MNTHSIIKPSNTLFFSITFNEYHYYRRNESKKRFFALIWVFHRCKVVNNGRAGVEIRFFGVGLFLLFSMSKVDPSRKTEIGLMIKQVRMELGLTQEELAVKSGTSKHYISRIENNKSGIELSTLIRIIEGGLGKRLQFKIV